MIYSNQIHKNSGLQAILENNGETIWLYINDSYGNTLRDCWVLNASPNIVVDQKREFTSPAPIQFTQNTPDTSKIKKTDFDLFWRQDGEAVHVSLFGNKVCCLRLEEGRGYNIYLNQICPWGLPYSELL
jgi:hypothetical protein